MDRESYVRFAENPKEALLKAADLLEAEGWTQHTSVGPQGQRCLSQAVSDVTGLGREVFATESAARRSKLWQDTAALLGAELGVLHTTGIVNWNDARERTQQEVVKLLRDVASRL
jgi:hypothetical protein